MLTLNRDAVRNRYITERRLAWATFDELAWATGAPRFWRPAKACLQKARQDVEKVGAPTAYYANIFGNRSTHRAGEPLWFEERELENKSWVSGTDEAHKVLNLRHTGWYSDDNQTGLVVGYVVELRHKRGFLAGYQEKESDGVLVDFSEIHDCQEDAARRGDRLAELSAEKEREYHESWRKGSQARTHHEEATAHWLEARHRLNNFRQANHHLSLFKDTPMVEARRVLRIFAKESLTAVFAKMNEAREARDNLINDCYREAAFNEGWGDEIVTNGKVNWPVVWSTPQE